MFESAPSNNPENNQESKKPKWERLDAESLPEPNRVAELIAQGVDGKENKREITILFNEALGEQVASLRLPTTLSDTGSTIDVFLEDRDPGQNTEDYNLTLKKTEGGYEWSSALKFKGSK